MQCDRAWIVENRLIDSKQKIYSAPEWRNDLPVHLGDRNMHVKLPICKIWDHITESKHQNAHSMITDSVSSSSSVAILSILTSSFASKQVNHSLPLMQKLLSTLVAFHHFPCRTRMQERWVRFSAHWSRLLLDQSACRALPWSVPVWECFMLEIETDNSKYWLVSKWSVFCS